MPFPYRRHPDPFKGPNPGRDDDSPDFAAEPCIPDELVDRVLDADADPATSEILRDLKRDRRGDSCPDLSACILSRVSASHGLLSSRGLRRVFAYRYAAAAAILLAISGLFIAQRLAPQTVRLAPTPTPVSRVVSAMPSEAGDVFSGVRSVFDSIRSAVPSPGPSPMAIRRVIERNESLADDWMSPVNPPMAAILWVDDRECARSCRAGCAGREPSRWTGNAGQITPGGVLVDETSARRRDAGVVFVTFTR